MIHKNLLMSYHSQKYECGPRIQYHCVLAIERDENTRKEPHSQPHFVLYHCRLKSRTASNKKQTALV